MSRSRLGAGLLLAGLLLSQGPATAAELSAGAPPVYVGGRYIATPAIMHGGHVFVPVRGFFEALRAVVQYTPPHIVVVRKGGRVIAGLVVDRRHAVVANRAQLLAATPIRQNGRVYVPLRVIAELAGATVAYSGQPAAIDIRVPAGPIGPPPTVAPAPVPEETTAPLWAMVLVGLLVAAFLVECLRHGAGAWRGRRRRSASSALKISNAAAPGDHYAIGKFAK